MAINTCVMLFTTEQIIGVALLAIGHLSEIEKFCSGHLSDSFGGHLSDGF